MLFKAALEFRHYTVLIYIWDNFPHLFKRQDLVAGLKAIIEKKDKILTKHMFNSATT